MRSRFHSITFPLLFLGIFCLNTFLIHSPHIGAVLLVVYLLSMGIHVVTWLQPSRTDEQANGRLWMGIWVTLSAVAILGSIAYYAASVPAILFQGIVIVSMASVLFMRTRIESHARVGHVTPLQERLMTIVLRMRWPIAAASICVIFSLGLFFQLLQAHPIVTAIRTPWDQFSPSILILFAIATLIVSILLYRGREKTLSISLFIFLIGSLFSFIAITYPIGYGFDSFIHKATENHLAQFGTITPKPFYYIGQYSIVLFIAHAFSLSIDLVDTWLLPLLATILLPLAWFSVANTILKKPRYALLTLLGLFLLPLDAFIVTTPQGLGNLWVLLAILASVPWLFEETSPNWIIIGIITLSTLLIHPIAGIPLFFFFALLFFSEHHNRLPDHVSNILKWTIVTAGSLALPASFMVQSIKSEQRLHLTFENLIPVSLALSASSALSALFQTRFSPLLDFVYLYGQNIFLLVLAASLGAWWMYHKDLSARIRVLFLMVIILGVNYLLLANVIDFSFLIDYERANYANRIIPLILFFASPFLILAFGHLSLNLRTKPIAIKLTCLVLLTMFASASFYLTFPRRDAYANSHAYNTSQADLDAVHLIEEWAESKPYIVLANQSVSAAAIKTIGFRYYGNLFFYPIPTGETMYQKFLAMNETPSRTTVESALALIPKDENVRTVFYVVDTYWWQADQIIEKTKAIANDWMSVGGSVYVFRFEQK